MNGNGETPRGGRPLPRSWGWAGLWLSLILIVLAVMMLLSGCGDPCADHGGTVNLNKGLFTCADGTVV